MNGRSEADNSPAPGGFSGREMAHWTPELSQAPDENAPAGQADQAPKPELADELTGKELSARPKQRALWRSGRDALGVWADMAQAEHHPRTLEKPPKGSTLTLRAMHRFQTAALRIGEWYGQRHESKAPQWPLPAGSEQIRVLGYGGERVAYNVKLDDGQDVVLSVYHLEGLRRDSHELAAEKQQFYETYREYFGDLVVPTAFLEVENPWGDGKKAATLQDRIEESSKLGDFTVDELKQRAAGDPDFAASLDSLAAGYRAMLQDGMAPDLASSNVLIRGSDILLPDTGKIFRASRLERLKKLHDTYAMIEELGNKGGQEPPYAA